MSKAEEVRRKEGRGNYGYGIKEVGLETLEDKKG